jgi:DNA-binding CsgD family transcriptional regulator
MLSDTDIQCMIALVNDVAASAETLGSRRRRLMARLGELLEANAWVWFTTALTDHGDPAPYYQVYDGLTGDLASAMAASYFEPRPEAIAMAGLAAMRGAAPVTFRRQDLVDDDAYFRHPTARRYFGALKGRLQSVCTFIPLRELGVAQGVGLHRVGALAPFTERDRTIAHLVLTAVPWLHRPVASPALLERVTSLTRRERLIVALLTDDMSVRALARRVGLSPHTVNDYTKSIYRHFGVNSRVELIALLSLEEVSPTVREGARGFGSAVPAGQESGLGDMA